jgi:hypothetical protein
LSREGRDPVSAGITLEPSGATARINRPADEAEVYAVLPAFEDHQARGRRGDGPGRRRAPAALAKCGKDRVIVSPKRESSCPLTPRRSLIRRPFSRGTGSLAPRRSVCTTRVDQAAEPCEQVRILGSFRSRRRRHGQCFDGKSGFRLCIFESFEHVWQGSDLLAIRVGRGRGSHCFRSRCAVAAGRT